MDSDVDLELECCSSPLSEAQVTAKTRTEDEYKQFMKKFNESLVKRNAELVEKGDHITVYEMECIPS